MAASKNNEVITITAPGTFTLTCSMPFDVKITLSDWEQIQKWVKEEQYSKIDAMIGEYIDMETVVNGGEFEFEGYEQAFVAKEQ